MKEYRSFLFVLVIFLTALEANSIFAQSLELDGSIQMNNVSSGISNIVEGNDYKGIIQFVSNDALSIFAKGDINLGHIARSQIPLLLYTNLLIKSNGDVGIGAIPKTKLHISDNAEIMRLNYNSSSHGYLSFYESNTRRAWLGFPSDGSDDLYFTNEHSGNIVLYNDPGFLEITQSGRLYTNTNGLRNIGNFRNMQYNPSTGEIGYDDSSRRSKQNIETLKDDWTKLCKTRPVQYSRFHSPDRSEIGYIAEEIDSVGLGHLVGYDHDGKPADVRYDRMVLYLTELVKDQQEKIDELIEQNRKQEERLLQLENDNN